MDNLQHNTSELSMDSLPALKLERQVGYFKEKYWDKETGTWKHVCEQDDYSESVDLSHIPDLTTLDSCWYEPFCRIDRLYRNIVF